MPKNAIHTVGKRKTAVARVWLVPGTGKLVVNRKFLDEYYIRASSKMLVMEPLELTETVGKYDIMVNVRGGGLHGQAGAIRHGISRALIEAEPELRPLLKKAGLLTRDSRKKERKLYGQPGARKRYQYSKR